MLAQNLTNFLDIFGLRKKIIAYVKNESFNSNVMTFALKFVVNYETLSLQKHFNGTYFWACFSQSMSICYY